MNFLTSSYSMGASRVDLCQKMSASSWDGARFVQAGGVIVYFVLAGSLSSTAIVTVLQSSLRLILKLRLAPRNFTPVLCNGLATILYYPSYLCNDVGDLALYSLSMILM